MWEFLRERKGVGKRCDPLSGNVEQLAISKLDAVVLVAVTAGFALRAVSDSVANGVGTTTMRAKDGDGHWN